MTEDEVSELQEQLDFLTSQNEELMKRNRLGFQIGEVLRSAWREYRFNRWLILLAVIGMLIWWEAMQIHNVDLQILEELQKNRSVRSDAKVILRRWS